MAFLICCGTFDWSHKVRSDGIFAKASTFASRSSKVPTISASALVTIAEALVTTAESLVTIA